MNDLRLYHVSSCN